MTTALPFHQPGHPSSWRSGICESALKSAGLVASVSGVVAAGLASAVLAGQLRGRVSDISPTDIDPRLYGPDVLGERLVIPPGIPDWIMMDCEKSRDSQTVLSKIQESVCDQH